ncbi:putative transposase [Mycobacterium xenopi 3993]|nr:putative transposase [Mycobacterium xenopi 3993]
MLELAASLKRENPTRTVAQVARILRTATGWAPSESTLLRHFHRLELMGPVGGRSRRCSAGSRPPTAMRCGSATACMGHGLGTAKTTSSRSSMITPGWQSAIGSASPKTPCAWPPRCARRWPPRCPGRDLRGQWQRIL